MVVFTCGHCGESLQKPKVEKHYMTKCRNRHPNLSCMDCFKDFNGSEYEAHTKCITEEQRYAAKGFVAKEKKGEQKQNVWVEMVQSVLDEQKSAPANVLRILEAVSKHNNTPRKKPKFVNFVKNICGARTHPKDIDAAWDMLAVKLSALSISRQANNVKKDDEAQSKIEEVPENSEENAIDEDKAETGDNANEENLDKKTKKQRKEEKKRKKYEAELNSAAIIPEGEEEEVEIKSKKDKKKIKESSSNGCLDNEVENEEIKTKKKRKRQDTANSAVSESEMHDNDMIQIQAAVENVQMNGERTKKKKAKTEASETTDIQVVEKTKKKKKQKQEDMDESVCLHEQNVANNAITEEIRSDNFNWHAVIMSVLNKKGNEVPFKRLQKKVLSEYAEVTGQDIDDRIADKFMKKLRSAPNVRVDKNRVTYVQ